MNKYSILIVDDEKIIRAALSYDLMNHEYDVSCADSGEKAIEMFKSNYDNNILYDLVITDMFMDSVDGIGVLKSIKEICPSTMVIILTGHGELHSAMDAVKFDADDYLLKPCKQEDLFFTIDKCFQKYELQKKVKVYENILPVCCVCNKIRDDSGTEKGKGKWLSMSAFLERKSNVEVSHTYCDECIVDVEKSIDRFKNS